MMYLFMYLFVMDAKMKCKNKCGSFDLKIHKDGSYEVGRITIEAFRSMFPNFSVTIDDNNQFVLNNFYNSTTNGSDDTQMVLEGTIDSNDDNTYGTCTATQVTSWTCSNGSLVAKAIDDDTIIDDDYPTLEEVTNASSCEASIVHYPLSEEYNTQVKDAIDSGNLSALLSLNTDLAAGNILAIEALTQYLKMINDNGLDGRVIIPDLEQTSRSPIFYIENNTAHIKLYPYYFKGEAKNNIGNYLKSLTDAIRGLEVDLPIVINVNDYHYPQSFDTGIESDTEPMENALTTLMKIRDSGFMLDRKMTLITPFGAITDDAIPQWEFYRTFHYFDEQQDKTLVLGGFCRIEYETAIVLTAISLTNSSVEWRGSETKDAIAHDVMATVAALRPPQDIAVYDLNFYGGGFSVTTQYNYQSPVEEIEMWSTFELGEPTECETRSPRVSYLQFANGQRDITATFENDDGSTVEKTYIAFDGISKTAKAVYMIEVSDRIPLTPSKITAPLRGIEYLGNIPVNGVEIVLLDKQGGDYYADIETVIQFLNAGASSVTYKLDTGEITTVTQGMMTSTGSSHRDILIFDKHDTENSTLEDGVLVVKNIDNMEVIREVVEAKDITLVDLTLLNANDAVTLMNFLGAIVPYSVNQSQVVDEWFAILKLMYALSYNIKCDDAVIGDVLYSEMSKDPSTYYDYKVMSNNIEKSPIDGIVYRAGTPPYAIGEEYVRYLEYVRDNITAGYTSYLSYFIENTIALDDGATYYINAKISGGVISTPTHTVDGNTHNDTNVKFVVNGFDVSTDIQASFDACVDPLPTNELYSIAKVDVSGGAYSITALSTIKAGWYATSRRCPEDGCVDVVEGFGAVDGNISEPHVTYSFVTNDDESVTITYQAFDEDGNDITDDFDTISFGDKFLHKTIDGGNDGKSI